jgi:hypothetical protein
MCEGHGGDLHMSIKDNFCLEGWVSSTLCELWFFFHCALDAHGHLRSFESEWVKILLNACLILVRAICWKCIFHFLHLVGGLM